MSEVNCTLEVVKQRYDTGEYDPYAVTVLSVDEAEGKRLVHHEGYHYWAGRGFSQGWEKPELILQVLYRYEGSRWRGHESGPRWVSAIKHNGEWVAQIDTPHRPDEAILAKGGRLLSHAAFARHADTINDFFGCDDVAEMLSPKGTVLLEE